MYSFNIYKKPTGEIKAVKKGWSLNACFFGPIWAFMKGLYGLGAVILLPYLWVPFRYYALSQYSYEFHQTPALLTYLWAVLAIWLGVKGNRLWENGLKKKGYEFMGTVNAVTPESAIALFSKR
ncbi:MAG TPA: hypothetical protein VIS48_13085 [Candidatus Kryptonia bacterium]